MQLSIHLEELHNKKRRENIMITVYLPQEMKDEKTGLFYKVWEVPEGLPLGEGIVYVAPSEELLFPRWDSKQGIWVEDKDSIIVYMKKQIDELTVAVEEIKKNKV